MDNIIKQLEAMISELEAMRVKIGYKTVRSRQAASYITAEITGLQRAIQVIKAEVAQ